MREERVHAVVIRFKFADIVTLSRAAGYTLLMVYLTTQSMSQNTQCLIT